MSFVRWALVTVPLILLLGFLSGMSVAAGEHNAWYVALIKPPLTPPGWVFPVVWTMLYVLMGLALATVFNARGAHGRGVAIALFAAQLMVSLAWTPVFFGMHRVRAALFILAAILGLAIGATGAFGRVRQAAAWLMVPYLVWISFAGALNWGILQLNPDAETLAPGRASTQIIG